jgi:hypothetical protein
MKVSLKKPMPRLLAGATNTQYSSNFQPIVERVRCWIVSKPIEGNCQLVDRRSSSFVGGANLTVMSYRRNEAGAEGAATGTQSYAIRHGCTRRPAQARRIAST